MGRKKRNNIGRLLLPLGAVGFLLIAALVFSPAERLEEDKVLAGLEIDPDSLSEGRHFGSFVQDSILTILTAIDSGGKMVSIQPKGDSIRFKRNPSYPPARFRRIFQHQRSSADFRRIKNSPISTLPGEDNGFTVPVREIEGVDYLVLPFDVVAGWMTEYGNLR